MFLPSPPSLISRPSKELAESPSSRDSLPNRLPAMLNNTSLWVTHSVTQPGLCQRQPQRSPLPICHRFLFPSFLPKRLLVLSSLSTCSWRECVEATPGWASPPLHEWKETSEVHEWRKEVGEVGEGWKGGKYDAFSGRREKRRQGGFFFFFFSFHWGRSSRGLAYGKGVWSKRWADLY